MKPKEYEILTEDLNSNRFIPKGKTTVKVILLEEHKKTIEKLHIEWREAFRLIGEIITPIKPNTNFEENK